MRKTRSKVPTPTSPSPGLQWGIFLSILLFALLWGLYQLDVDPPGLSMDQGFMGLGGLRILHEGWRPTGTLPYLLVWPLILYQTAGWFLATAWAFPENAHSLFLFFLLLSLAAFPFIYLFFRELAGPRQALLALFFFAVMFWREDLARKGMPSLHVLLYEFGCLYFLTLGLRKGRTGALGLGPLALAAPFFAAGFYCYQAYKIFPLLVLLYVGWEIWGEGRRTPGRAKAWTPGLALFGGLSLVLTAPILWEWARQGAFTDREQVFFIGTAIREQQSLRPLLQHLADFLLLFNWKGFPYPHPQLDLVTGLLFLFGLVGAIRRFREPGRFHALTGFLVLSLPLLLSRDMGTHRMGGALPFIALLAAQCAGDLWAKFRGLKAAPLVAGALLFFVLGQNFFYYSQARDLDTPKTTEFALDATRLGDDILHDLGAQYCLAPSFAQNFTVQFLTYAHRDQVAAFRAPEGLMPSLDSPYRRFRFVLEKGKKGWLDLLGSLYPGGKVQEEKDGQGQVLFHSYEVPKEVLEKGRGGAHGCFLAAQTGYYCFYWKGGQGVLHLAGRDVAAGAAVPLAKGFYSIDLLDKKAVAFHLGPTGSGGPDHPLNADLLTTLPLDHGLLCHFTCADPVLDLWGWDPLVNITNTGDLPYPAASFDARWTGDLVCPVAGRYDLKLLTNETGALWVDGKALTHEGPKFLAKGPHSIVLALSRHRRENWVRFDFHLLWKLPGRMEFEVIPPSAFGRTHPLSPSDLERKPE